MSLKDLFQKYKNQEPYIYLPFPNKEKPEITLKIERPSPMEVAQTKVKGYKAADSSMSDANAVAMALAYMELIKA